MLEPRVRNRGGTSNACLAQGSGNSFTRVFQRARKVSSTDSESMLSNLVAEAPEEHRKLSADVQSDHLQTRNDFFIFPMIQPQTFVTL